MTCFPPFFIRNTTGGCSLVIPVVCFPHPPPPPIPAGLRASNLSDASRSTATLASRQVTLDKLLSHVREHPHKVTSNTRTRSEDEGGESAEELLRKRLREGETVRVRGSEKGESNGCAGSVESEMCGDGDHCKSASAPCEGDLEQDARTPADRCVGMGIGEIDGSIESDGGDEVRCTHGDLEEEFRDLEENDCAKVDGEEEERGEEEEETAEERGKGKRSHTSITLANADSEGDGRRRGGYGAEGQDRGSSKAQRGARSARCEQKDLRRLWKDATSAPHPRLVCDAARACSIISGPGRFAEGTEGGSSAWQPGGALEAGAGSLCRPDAMQQCGDVAELQSHEELPRHGGASGAERQSLMTSLVCGDAEAAAAGATGGEAIARQRGLEPADMQCSLREDDSGGPMSRGVRWEEMEDGGWRCLSCSEEGTRINTALAGRKPQGQSVPISVGEQRSKRSGTLKRLRVNGGTKKKPKTLQHKRLIQ